MMTIAEQIYTIVNTITSDIPISSRSRVSNQSHDTITTI